MSVTFRESLPPSILLGLTLGATFALLAVGLFVVGERWFPSRQPAGERYTSEQRRRAEIRAYLTQIGERYAEDHPVAGTPVAFYLPERDVAVTFDAHAYFRIRNATDTAAVLVEHELPGRNLGKRLPFEVPEVEPERTRDVDPVRSAFDALGLPTTADAAAVRHAYRDLVKEVHPDHGGDRETFRRLQEAYATASEHAE